MISEEANTYVFAQGLDCFQLTQSWHFWDSHVFMARFQTQPFSKLGILETFICWDDTNLEHKAQMWANDKSVCQLPFLKQCCISERTKYTTNWAEKTWEQLCHFSCHIVTLLFYRGVRKGKGGHPKMGSHPTEQQPWPMPTVGLLVTMHRQKSKKCLWRSIRWTTCIFPHSFSQKRTNPFIFPLAACWVGMVGTAAEAKYRRPLPLS